MRLFVAIHCARRQAEDGTRIAAAPVFTASQVAMFLCSTPSPLLALNGHDNAVRRCEVSRVKRTWGEGASMSVNDPKRTLAQPEFYFRRSDRSSVAALAGLAGALSTAMQAGGKSFSFSPRDEPPNSGIFKRRIQSVNQWSSDLSHPSPPGTAGCVRQSGESAGHFRRTCM